MAEPTAKPSKLSDRDLLMLRGFFESRIMTIPHVAANYCSGAAENAKKALQKLKSRGFIAERPRNPFEPSILYLTKAGLLALSERGALRDYPDFSIPSLERRAQVSPMTVAHELEMMDVKAAVSAAVAARPGLALAEFTTWPLLNEFEAFGTLVKPDGFIRIHEKEADGGLSEHCFFVEVDRSTEPQQILANRGLCYLNYYKSGGFAERCGAARTAFNEYPFRVLYVLKNEERRNNTIESLLRLPTPILTHVWLATMPDVLADPLGAIWIQPVDYRDATKGTPYSPTARTLTMGYKRETAREIFVRERAIRSHLIA